MASARSASAAGHAPRRWAAARPTRPRSSRSRATRRARPSAGPSATTSDDDQPPTRRRRGNRNEERHAADARAATEADSERGLRSLRILAETVQIITGRRGDDDKEIVEIVAQEAPAKAPKPEPAAEAPPTSGRARPGTEARPTPRAGGDAEA